MSNFLWRFIPSAAALAALLVVGHTAPAAAQASDAADRCTPDVMRLCNEFIPDPDRIVACLRTKRAQLSPSCRTALTRPSATAKAKGKKKRRASQ
jgi:hypothetical protein